jgi:gamma-glutamyl:cysteine ligase YbdK (ATP-grasp superfamily)
MLHDGTSMPTLLPVKAFESLAAAMQQERDLGSRLLQVHASWFTWECCLGASEGALRHRRSEHSCKCTRTQERYQRFPEGFQTLGMYMHCDIRASVFSTSSGKISVIFPLALY